MKKTMLISAICMGVMICFAPALAASAAEETAPFAGSGTTADPYQIDSAFRLRLLSEIVNDASPDYAGFRSACYIQTSDIDLRNVSWIPIGSYKESGSASLSFNGCYDGNYHMIKNLNCDTETDYAGLFGMIGSNPETQKNTCVLSNISVYGCIKAEGENAGGIAGQIGTGGIVQNCSFIGNTSGAESTGGLVGTVYSDCTIINCYHNGIVSAKTNAGGLAGSVHISSMPKAASASFINSFHTGGIVSAAAKDGIIGGIAGFTEESTTSGIPAVKADNNFYLTVNCKYAVNNHSADGCTALSDAEMKKGAERLDAPFVTDTGQVNGGYPVLKWQKAFGYSGDINSDSALTKDDVLLLQKYLSGYPDLKIRNWIAGDLDENETLDASDLTMMKRRLIAASNMTPEKVELNKYSANLKLEGEGSTVQLFAGISPETESNQNVTWETSNAKVASVSKDGLVQAVASGKAVITAKTASGSLSATCNITVEQPSISINQADLSIYVTESQTLEAASVPSQQTIAWKSDNTKVATVKNGVITAVAAGSANITASFNYNGKEVVSEKCAVTVLPPDLTLDQTEISMYPASSAALTATVHPENANIRWVSSDIDILTVKNGEISAAKPGTAVVSARINVNGEAYSADCTITVKKPSINIEKRMISMYIGGRETLDVVVEPGDSQITWTSSNTQTVTVDNGKIHGILAGLSDITAKISINGIDYISTCRVDVIKPEVHCKSSINLNSGESVTLSVTDEQGRRILDGVSFASSNSRIASVSSNGTIHADTMKYGEATILVTRIVNGKSYVTYCIVNVGFYP